MDGITLEFACAETPFFTNKELSRSYEVGPVLGDDERLLEQGTGTAIEWKDGQCLTHEEKQKKQRAKKGKNKGQVRRAPAAAARSSSIQQQRPDGFCFPALSCAEQVALEAPFDPPLSWAPHRPLRRPLCPTAGRAHAPILCHFGPQVRYVTEKVKKDSFFNWFEALDVDALSAIEDEDEAEAMMAQFNQDYAAARLVGG